MGKQKEATKCWEREQPEKVGEQVDELLKEMRRKRRKARFRPRQDDHACLCKVATFCDEQGVRRLRKVCLTPSLFWEEGGARYSRAAYLRRDILKRRACACARREGELVMTHRNTVRGFRRGVNVGVMMLCLALLFAGSGLAYSPPVGLPDSPELPDLYDPEIVNTYTIVAKRPYHVNGQPLAPWLIATVLTPKAVHVGPPSVSNAPNVAGATLKYPIFMIGYVTDTRDGRIIALTETFANPGDGSRSVKAWVDQGWVTKGKGSGDWGPPLRSSTALTPKETAAFMERVYSLIQTGLQQTLKR